MFASPSVNTMFALDVMRFVPLPVIEWLQDRMKGGPYQISRDVEKTVYKVAEELITTKAEYLKAGKGGRDVFSLIGRSQCCPSQATEMLSRLPQSRQILLKTSALGSVTVRCMTQ
jgi:hypothetical protein